MRFAAAIRISMTILGLGFGAHRLWADEAVPAGNDRQHACIATGRVVGAPFRVRGRLYAADGGGSGYRIWLVGTKRIVWVSWRIDPPVPNDVTVLFRPFSEEVYADFVLQGLAPDRPWVMREVCITQAEHPLVRPVLEP